MKSAEPPVEQGAAVCIAAPRLHHAPVGSGAAFEGNRYELTSPVELPAATAIAGPLVAAPAPVVAVTSLWSRIEHFNSPASGPPLS